MVLANKAYHWENIPDSSKHNHSRVNIAGSTHNALRKYQEHIVEY